MKHPFSQSSASLKPTKSSIFLWNILAFQAGSLNAGGFLACNRFVTHVTGFATLFGTEFSFGKYSDAFGYLSVPIFFLIGSMISGYFIDIPIQRNTEPRHSWAFLILLLITGIVLALGITNNYGNFGETLQFGKDYSLLALLCLASGIQNAMVTSTYGSVVRTSHLTGLTTDLGIGLIRIFLGPKKPELKDREAFATFMRVGIILSFTVGSLFAAVIFTSLQWWGFLIPFLISLGLLLFSLGFFDKKSESEKR